MDKNKYIKDLRVAKHLLEEAEDELFKYEHYNPKRFPEQYGGCAYERVQNCPDWVLDYWHPVEKEMYPKYFAKREQRKQEYLKFFQSQYAKSKEQVSGSKKEST